MWTVFTVCLLDIFPCSGSFLKINVHSPHIAFCVERVLSLFCEKKKTCTQYLYLFLIPNLWCIFPFFLPSFTTFFLIIYYLFFLIPFTAHNRSVLILTFGVFAFCVVFLLVLSHLTLTPQPLRQDSLEFALTANSVLKRCYIRKFMII